MQELGYNVPHLLSDYAYLSVLLHQFKQYLSDNRIIYDENILIADVRVGLGEPTPANNQGLRLCLFCYFNNIYLVI